MERKQEVCVKVPKVDDIGENEFCKWAGGSIQGWREF